MRRGTVILGKRPGLPPMWRASVGLRERQPNAAQRAAHELDAALSGRYESIDYPTTTGALVYLAVAYTLGAVSAALRAVTRR